MQRKADSMECLADVRAILGEGPCWSVRDQRLLWVDINAPELFEWTETNGLSRHPLTEKICSIVPRDSGGFIGAGHNGVLAFDDAYQIKHLFNPEAHLPENRFNDGKVDRAGRFWAGTMDHAEQASNGTLYRIDPDLGCTAIDTGYRVTNGPAFSVDGRIMYHTDSALQRVYAFILDSKGNATHRKLFLQFKHEDGYPDGMTVDAENCLWIAFWDGWCIRRFSPDGEMLLEVPMPVQRPTSVAFGGTDMDRIFISSASRDLTAEERCGQPDAGGLFSFKPGVRGIAEMPFAG
ncbi:MAG: SMP-30/gluconolactonase/LRE family protein [Sphingomonadaceae bacterium]|nr:SMP-30/gluconolactonase/LRE family protein [Sphingomonadaceae bacterium]